MLMKTPAPGSAMTFALVGKYAVRLAVNTRCPHCTTLLHAHDIEVDFGDVRLICQGCHKDVFTIGSAS